MSRLGRSQEAYDRFSAAVALPLVILSLLWLIVLVPPLVIRLPAAIASTFEAIDYFVWACFVIDYGVKLYLAPRRRRFVTQHIFDLAVIVLPLLRPLRALRLVRVLNLFRAGIVLAVALQRSRQMFMHRGLHFVFLAVLVIVAVCAALELAYEQTSPESTIHNYGDSLWWAVVTVTTVGYGDKYSVTAGGRGVAVVLMLVGIGLIGVLTATVASYFVEQNQDKETAELHQRLDRIEGMLAKTLSTTERMDETESSQRDGPRVLGTADALEALSSIAIETKTQKA